MNTNSKTSARQAVARTVRCAIYTRVSTDDQAQGEYSSLDAQKDICEHYIAIHKEEGWISALHIEDSGYSGSTMDRPGINNLLAEARAGNVDMIVVYKLDRLSRSLRQFYGLWEELRRHNVNFASATQQIDTATPHGMLFLNMLLSFAEFEREQTRERTRHKLIQRAQQGKWNGGWVPTGYDYDKKNQKLILKPAEQELVAKAFDEAVQLKNPTAVAKHLNKMGWRTRKRTIVLKDGSTRVVGDKRFVSGRVQEMIANPIYKGIVINGDKEYPSEHPAIVSPQLWQAANEALRPKEKEGPIFLHQDRHVHLLKGLLKCGHCGLSLTPKPAGKKDKHGNQYLYYTCTNVSKEGEEAKCSVRNIPARPFEDLIVGYIGEIGKHPDIIKASIKAADETKNKGVKPLKAKLAELDRRFDELSVAIKNFMDTAKKEGAKRISAEMIREAEQLAEEKRQVELEREKVKIDIQYREKVVTDARLIADSLLQFGKVFRALPPEDQKELIRLLVKEVTVNHFDPEKDQMPPQPGVFKARIRTKWYLVNMTLYATDLFTGVSPKEGDKFVRPKGWLREQGSNLQHGD